MLFYQETISTEIKGIRPVLIISDNWYNKNSNRVIFLPLTRYFNKEGKIMTDQIHSLDKQRISDKITDLTNEIFAKVMIDLSKLIDFKKFNTRT